MIGVDEVKEWQDRAKLCRNTNVTQITIPLDEFEDLCDLALVAGAGVEFIEHLREGLDTFNANLANEIK